MRKSRTLEHGVFLFRSGACRRGRLPGTLKILCNALQDTFHGRGRVLRRLPLARRARILVTLVLAVAFALAAVEWSAAQQQDCARFQQELKRKKLLLADYYNALEKLDSRGDRVVVSVLTHKIEELTREIGDAEKTSDCAPGPKAIRASSGMSPMKSDDGKFATKSCAELKNLLIRLLQKDYALKRRRGSMLSEMSPEELAELRDTTDSLRSVRASLRSKCPAVAPADEAPALTGLLRHRGKNGRAAR